MRDEPSGGRSSGDEVAEREPRGAGDGRVLVALGGSGFPLAGVLAAIPRAAVSFEWFTCEEADPYLFASVVGPDPGRLSGAFERDRTVRAATRIEENGSRRLYRVRLGSRAADSLQCCLDGGLVVESIESTRQGFVGTLTVPEGVDPEAAVSRLDGACGDRALTVGRPETPTTTPPEFDG